MYFKVLLVTNEVFKTPKPIKSFRVVDSLIMCYSKSPLGEFLVAAVPLIRVKYILLVEEGVE